MGNHQYYMLLSSLPALQRFDRAERLPISRERLMNRMNMLLPEDAETIVAEETARAAALGLE